MSVVTDATLVGILSGPDGRATYEAWLQNPVTKAVLNQIRLGFGTAQVPAPTASGLVDPTAVFINHGVIMGVQGVLTYLESVPQVVDYTAAQKRFRESKPYQSP
jgi:anti-sigma factor RsiW